MTEENFVATFNPDQLRAEAAIRKAAQAGNAEAQFRLGVMFGNGDGVALDYAQAESWFEKAAAQGHENALITRCLSAITGPYSLWKKLCLFSSPNSNSAPS